MTPHTITHYELWYRRKRTIFNPEPSQWASGDPHYASEEAARLALNEAKKTAKSDPLFKDTPYEYQLCSITSTVTVEEGGL